MSLRLLDVQVDLSQLKGLEAALTRLSGEVVGQACAAAVNVVVERFDKQQRRDQVLDINLPQSYVDNKTTTTRAVPGTEPQATIRTAGATTPMGRYPTQRLTNPDGVDRAGRRLGQRQAGVGVRIKRSGESTPDREPRWFLMKLRNQDFEGVFERSASGRLVHRYAVSPYSLARHQAVLHEQDIVNDLERTAAAALADALGKELGE